MSSVLLQKIKDIINILFHSGATKIITDSQDSPEIESPLENLKDTMLNDLKNLFISKNYVIDDTINIIGFRNPENSENSEWNDYIGIYMPKLKEIFLFTGTTDPSWYWTQNPDASVSGCMHLFEGQYIESYVVGNHRGKPAVCQWGKNPVKIWRDVNKNGTFEPEVDMISRNSWDGTNIHYPSKNEIEKIVYSSAGCQVIAPDKNNYFAQWDFFFYIVKNSGNEYFNYTLFNISELPDSIKYNINSILNKGE